MRSVSLFEEKDKAPSDLKPAEKTLEAVPGKATADDGDKRSGTTYPYFSLEIAVEVARQARKQGGTDVTDDVLVAALKLGSKSSRHYTYRISSAREFGLLVRVGRGDDSKLQITDLCKRILLPESDAEAQAARMEAFLRPKLYAQLVQRYLGSEVPEAQGLANVLVRHHKLLESVSIAAAEAFLASARYAGAVSADGRVTDSISSTAQPEKEAQPESQAPSQPQPLAPKPGVQTIEVPESFVLHQFPLRKGLRIVVPLPEDLRNTDVQRLHAWLQTLPIEDADA